MKKKIELKAISIKSFITEEQAKDLKGGIIQTEWCSNGRPCIKPY